MAEKAKAMLAIRLLGPFHLELGQQPIAINSWTSKKALLLLKYLASRYSEKIPSDLLIDLFWPDSDFEAANRNLHSTIYFLRKTLKDHAPDEIKHLNWVRFSNGLYWLDITGPVSLDLREFTNLNLLSAEMERQEPVKAIRSGLQALDLYRGDFLQEDLYVGWTAAMRASYQVAYVELALRTSNLLIKHKQKYKEAAHICKTALTHNPYREELHQMLIQCLIAMRRFPEAFLQYDHCARILKTEFDLEPSTKTRALLEDIKNSTLAQRDLVRFPNATDKGVFVCEKRAFESILNLEQRRLERFKQPTVLMTICIDKRGPRGLMDHVFSALMNTLRKSDAAAQWSESLIVVLLTGTSAYGANQIQKRIRTYLDAGASPYCRFTNHVLSKGENLKSPLSLERQSKTASH